MLEQAVRVRQALGSCADVKVKLKHGGRISFIITLKQEIRYMCNAHQHAHANSRAYIRRHSQ